jgi:predicted transcriptional regulator
VTVHLPSKVEEELRSLAVAQGRPLDVLVEEAIEQYIQAASITDTTPSDVAATQEALLGELPRLAEWTADPT